MNESEAREAGRRPDVTLDLCDGDRDKNNFFSRMGLVTRAESGSAVRTPIHELGSVPIKPPKSGSSHGAVGGQASTHPQGGYVLQDELDYKLFDAPSVHFPNGMDDPNDRLPLYKSIHQEWHEIWMGFAEEVTLLYLCGMRGSSETWAYIREKQENGLAASVARSDSYTECMKEMNERWPIRAPQFQFASWHKQFKFGLPLKPEDAAASAESPAAITAEHIDGLRGLFNGSICVPGFKGFEMPAIRFGADMEFDSKQRIWLVPTEVASALEAIMGRDGIIASNKYLAEHFGKEYVRRTMGIPSQVFYFRGFIFMVYDKLPKYRGGANSTVPIVRTLILGRNALTFEYATRCPATTIEKRFADLRSKGRILGSPYFTWVYSEKGRWDEIVTQLRFGIRKNYVSTPSQERRRFDKGIIAFDVPLQGEFL